MTEIINSNQEGTITHRDPRELKVIFEQAEELPTLPEVAVRLQEVVDDPKSDAKDVAKIIEDDPAIAAKVLKMVNSVFYSPGRGEEITQLQPAITRMGFVTVTNIVLSTSVFQAFGRAQQPIFNRREFWRHSVCVGIVAALLYETCRKDVEQRVTRDAVHLAGIVHDMGKILFERYANEEFHAALENAKASDLPVLKEECRMTGMGHDEAGAWLAQKWKLDEAIQAVVRWHHEPFSCAPEYQPLVKLVHLADYICHEKQLGDSGNPCVIYNPQVQEDLRLSQEKIEELMPLVDVEAANSDILLALAD